MGGLSALAELAEINKHYRSLIDMTGAAITPAQLKELLTEEPSPLLVDVRTPAEFREVHIVGAANIPLDRLSADALRAATNGSGNSTIYFICKSGMRGQKACEKIWKLGLENVANVEGGTEACVAAGLEVERGRKAISLERQVRIAAGTLVLTGAVLAITVHAGFAGISAFVGAGLIFAGVTDTCAMGMLLAKMPWNQAINPSDCRPHGHCSSSETGSATARSHRG